MGKKSKKKTGAARQQPQQQNTNFNNATSSSSSTSTVAATTVANASPTIQEEIEPFAKFDFDAWEARFPFAEKATAPQAKELDKAHELFLQGIQLAKTDLYVAAEYIASAFARDERVVILQNGRNDERALPLEILNSMVQVLLSPDASFFLLGVIFLILALPSTMQLGKNQNNVAIALKCINDSLDTPSEDMSENSTLSLMGGLTRAKLYYWRGRLYKEMFNGKSALKDWNKALELDPSLAVTRLERLRLWVITAVKTQAELHAECTIFLGLIHEDYSELDVIYARLALATFLDVRLGTYADAMDYYMKSIQATSRRVEVYGPREQADCTVWAVREIMGMAYDDPEGDEARTRKESDTIMRMDPSNSGAELEQKLAVDKTERNLCLKCKKHEGHDGIQLRKCNRCKRVYYCSKECIRANWKEHKWFCHSISEYKS